MAKAITVGQLRKALEGIDDALEVRIFEPGDYSVGISDVYGLVTAAGLCTDPGYPDADPVNLYFELLVAF